MPDEQKGDNLGAGLPKDIFAQIVNLLTGAAAKGTTAEQLAVFLELAREEHAAIHPGGGSTSVADATVKYMFVAQAADALAAATNPAEATAAINKLAPSIKAVGKQWVDFGPVGDAFLDSVPKPK
jgi:hypothetical protein